MSAKVTEELRRFHKDGQGHKRTAEVISDDRGHMRSSKVTQELLRSHKDG